MKSDDDTNPFAIAVAAGIAAGRNSAVSRLNGGLSGLDRLADRFSAISRDAIQEGLQRLGLDEEAPAAARQDPTMGRE